MALNVVTGNLVVIWSNEMTDEVKIDPQEGDAPAPTKANADNATDASTPVKVNTDNATSEIRWTDLLEIIEAKPFDQSKFEEVLNGYIETQVKKSGMGQYTILYLIDAERPLSSWHSNRIYQSATSADEEKPILLVLNNRGGRIETGYLISKTCKKLCKDKFMVAVPREAKSAATLLALGAEEIHMGLMSQLGPIDAQVRNLPASGMKSALEILSDITCRYPGASIMISEYLEKALDPNFLGYLERVNDSAVQYAERLLGSRSFPESKTSLDIAKHFVHHYKDHGFVIDYDESQELLGENMVKKDTKEYSFSNEIYEVLDIVNLFLEFELKKEIRLVGRGKDAIHIFDKKD